MYFDARVREPRSFGVTARTRRRIHGRSGCESFNMAWVLLQILRNDLMTQGGRGLILRFSIGFVRKIAHTGRIRARHPAHPGLPGTVGLKLSNVKRRGNAIA